MKTITTNPPTHLQRALGAALSAEYGHRPNLPLATVQIDKIHIYAPCSHKPLGKTVLIREQGIVDPLPAGATRIPIMLKGDAGENWVHSKEINDSGNMAHVLEIRCCPPLVLQKHNLFGHGDLQAYIFALLVLITRQLGIKVNEFDCNQWLKGAIKLTEIHLTVNFRCPSSAVLDIIQAIDDNNSAGKTRVHATCISLGYTPKRRSTYRMVTVYDKAEEMKQLPGWKKPGKYQTMLLEHAKDSLRVEIKLFNQELTRRRLNYVKRWAGVDVNKLYFDYLDKFEIGYSIPRLVTEDELATLSKAELRAYVLWLSGQDIKKHYSRTTAWKYAKAIKDKVGVNIKGNRRPDKLADIDLPAVLSPENMVPVPPWAIGTEYYVTPDQTELLNPKAAAEEAVAQSAKPTSVADIDFSGEEEFMY